MKMFQTFLVLALASQMLVACGSKPAETPAPTSSAPAAAAPAGAAAPAPGETPAAAQQPGEDVVRFEEAGVQFKVPAGWTRMEQDGATVLASPDRQVVVSLKAAPTAGANALTAQDVVDIMKGFLEDVKVDGEPKTGELKGMKWITVSGTGTSKEKGPMRWAMDLVEAKKAVVATYFGIPEAWEANKAVLATFDENFQPIDEPSAGAAGPGADGSEPVADESPAPGSDEAAPAGDEGAAPADEASPADEGGH